MPLATVVDRRSVRVSERDAPLYRLALWLAGCSVAALLLAWSGLDYLIRQWISALAALSETARKVDLGNLGRGRSTGRDAHHGFRRPAVGRPDRRVHVLRAERIDHLHAGSAGGLNGAYRLNATTVHNDAAVDELSGNEDPDWFFARIGGSRADRVRNRLDSEVLTTPL